MRPSVAAIVVTYRTGPVLKDCLTALLANPHVDAVVVADNGNPPDMTAWLAGLPGRYAKARYLAAPANLGFGRAVNLGARGRTEDHLLVINPDCIMRHDAVPALQAALAGRHSPVIVGGRIFDLKGRNQAGPQRREPTLARVLARMLGGAGIDYPVRPQPDGPVRRDAVSGAFFLVDRAGFERLGGFDEAYFLHVEDLDLCKRAALAGGEVIYQPDAGALHHGATSDVPTLFVERHKADGFARYFRKFARGPFHRLAVELSLPLIRAGLLLRASWRARQGRH